MPRGSRDLFVIIVTVLIIPWLLYLAYEVAKHVGAWPFG